MHRKASGIRRRVPGCQTENPVKARPLITFQEARRRLSRVEPGAVKDRGWRCCPRFLLPPLAVVPPLGDGPARARVEEREGRDGEVRQPSTRTRARGGTGSYHFYPNGGKPSPARAWRNGDGQLGQHGFIPFTRARVEEPCITNMMIQMPGLHPRARGVPHPQFEDGRSRRTRARVEEPRIACASAVLTATDPRARGGTQMCLGNLAKGEQNVHPTAQSLTTKRP